MHVAFIPYGIKDAVDILIRDMQSQKFWLHLYKKGEKDKVIWMQGQLRVLPFGIYEYMFPKEYKDIVMTTLRFNKLHSSVSAGSKLIIAQIRKALNLKKVPEFEKKGDLPWMKENVSFIPIGYKEDGEIMEQDGEFKGWKHEAI